MKKIIITLLCVSSIFVSTNAQTKRFLKGCEPQKIICQDFDFTNKDTIKLADYLLARGADYSIIDTNAFGGILLISKKTFTEESFTDAMIKALSKRTETDSSCESLVNLMDFLLVNKTCFLKESKQEEKMEKLFYTARECWSKELYQKTIQGKASQEELKGLYQVMINPEMPRYAAAADILKRIYADVLVPPKRHKYSGFGNENNGTKCFGQLVEYTCNLFYLYKQGYMKSEGSYIKTMEDLKKLYQLLYELPNSITPKKQVLSEFLTFIEDEMGISLDTQNLEYEILKMNR